MYHNLPNLLKSKSPDSFLVTVKYQSSSKVCPVVHAVVSNQNTLKSSTIKAVTLTNGGMQVPFVVIVYTDI